MNSGARAQEKKVWSELHTFSFNNQLSLTQYLAALPQSAKMAPKRPFKVHSLNKHIEETTKGLNANTRSKKASAKPLIKKAGIVFPNNDSDSGSSSSSSDDSESDGPEFMKNLAKPKASKRRSKDDEIADSDVERTSAARKSKSAKKAAAPAKAKASSSSNETSSDADSESSDEEVSDKGAALKSKASTSAGSPTSSSGSDSDSGSSSSSEAPSSDDDAESESETEIAPAKPQPASAKGPESDSDSSSAEESESESEESSQLAAKPASKPTANGAKPSGSAANATESDGESDDSNEEESSDEDQSGTDSSDEEADESMQIAERAQASEVALPQLLPPDFELRKSDQQSNGQDVARVCSEAHLEGKQLWYFTLPANVPVSVVENLEFPMDASQQGGSILSHNGEDYGISFDSTPPVKSIQILIPSTDGSTYQPCKKAQQNVDQL